MARKMNRRDLLKSVPVIAATPAVTTLKGETKKEPEKNWYFVRVYCWNCNYHWLVKVPKKIKARLYISGSEQRRAEICPKCDVPDTVRTFGS